MLYTGLTGMYSVHSVKYTKELIESYKTEIIKNEDDCLKKEKIKNEELKIKTKEIMENKNIEIGVSKAKDKSNQPNELSNI
ncbi:hypothetical protein [Tenacibaculum finnmarkense]|uniref:hypothetical protein n=1 Tax=Tenacibaculum finnmarkense TaxID=2781243 RepID=UPI001E4F1E72|nr:hypothetical protein [Tenacibaculum finnmarkense]MCD8413626.1 hypothetical protein [Tenacibaculum finnmarkense genomovar ulcerans]